MATISENLQILKDSTDAIKQAIIDKGGTINGDITTWASAISGLSGSGLEGSDESITFSGTIEVATKQITFNGYLSNKPSDALAPVYLCATCYPSEVLHGCVSITAHELSNSISLECSSSSIIMPSPDFTGFCLYIFYQGPNSTWKIVPVRFIEIETQGGGISGGNTN